MMSRKEIKEQNKVRYALTPQMLDYDIMGTVWLPYIMFFQTPDYVSGTVNTDSRGFRVTYKGQEKLENFKGFNKNEACLFCGGSSAFGVGATHDRLTVPSLLNQSGNGTWVNMGGRAHSSTQELLLFLLNRQHFSKIRKVVIFGGINDLFLYHASGANNKEENIFFFGSRFKKAMDSERFRDLSLKMKIKALLSSASGKRRQLNYGVAKAPEDVLYTLKRDVETWKLFSSSLGFELTYVLQPLCGWTEKRLSLEEEKLFKLLDDRQGGHFKTLKECLDKEQYRWYSEGLENICRQAEIRYLDINKSLSGRKLDGKWIFVDRIHLTDEGNKIAADILREEGI